MFGKKCPQCSTSIKKEFEFCPSCGINLTKKYEQEDYGFLGKDDSVNQMPTTPFTETFIDKIFSTAMKLLEKQMKNLNEEIAKNPSHPMNPNRLRQNQPSDLNIQFFVNGKQVFGNQETTKSKQIRINPKIFNDKLKKSTSLTKKEPESRLKRLAGRLIYELYVPGVKSVEDILINKLENSIEIKALSDESIYTKNLNLNLPILRYMLKDDFLTIELQGQ